jgi:hypothetical protein
MASHADDPIAAARGALKGLAGDISSEEMRHEARAEEGELERRRTPRS